MLQVGTTITAQQKYGEVFTGEIVDGSYTTTGGIRYVVRVDDDNAKKLGHFMSAGLCYVYADEIVTSAVGKHVPIEDNHPMLGGGWF